VRKPIPQGVERKEEAPILWVTGTLWKLKDELYLAGKGHCVIKVFGGQALL